MSEPVLPPQPASPANGVLSAMARRPLAALLLLCILAWLPGFSTLPALDRDEARFAQSSKQMVESGNWVDIRFADQHRYKKPIGIYWLQAAATKIFGHSPFNQIWTYRLPSLLGAVIAVFLAFWCLSAMAAPETALAGAGLLALTLGLTAEAHIAKTDAVLLASILAAEGVLLRAYLAARDGARKRPGVALLMAGWAAFAIGILIKGPLIAAVLGLTALSVSLWDRDWRWISQLRPLSGLALTLVLVLPWFIAIGIASHGAFFSQALGHDFAGKLVGGQESHGAPPGYYLIATTLTLWPATLFVLPGIGRALGRRTEPAMRFLLGWAGASWLMFALVPTKLPHYILPVYPALAFMGTLWLMGEGEETGSGRILRWIASVQFVIGTLALSAGLVFLPIKYGDGAPSWLMLLAGLAALTGIAAAVLMAKQRRIYALAAAAMTALIVYPTLMWGVGPRLEKIWVSPRLAALVAKDKRPGDPPVVTSGYDEPSLIFLLGTHTRIAGPAEAAAITASTGGLALIGKKQDQPFRMRLSALGASARAVDHLSGINYSHGRAVAITIYRVTPAPKYALAE